LPPWIFEAWHFILSRELGLPHQSPRWLKQPAVMAVPITTPQVMERLGCFKEDLRPFTVVTVPFPRKEVGQLWTGFFIMPYTEKLDNLHGRPMVNVVSGATFYIYDENSSTSGKSPGWLALRTMEDEVNHLLSRAESKFCTPNGSRCTSKTIGLLVRRHIVAGEFHYIGKEASTRWTGGLGEAPGRSWCNRLIATTDDRIFLAEFATTRQGSEVDCCYPRFDEPASLRFSSGRPFYATRWQSHRVFEREPKTVLAASSTVRKPPASFGGRTKKWVLSAIEVPSL
jgi:hypothetical protein